MEKVNPQERWKGPEPRISKPIMVNNSLKLG